MWPEFFDECELRIRVFILFVKICIFKIKAIVSVYSLLAYDHFATGRAIEHILLSCRCFIFDNGKKT